ncbi:leucyl aminopeptidase [Candidatus Purcelliella pentastirinorum]|uniref:Probable cytosol aminopeptidase n=1 Tax=Candidatus Purcelliella pentastirinorum TaxID=472834 RepID=A0AAX3N8I4_9ENTR|nr:leucyl aminopeptidase [Candidatus Purcelliella pentastirinorum]WDI78698.1 leucyl aminopeptidase [Candidatus Purcelliella pentastirinorum]WDR80690.1 leucyl aminopeptidase [Candidatus Purcelliella pentastirinorum]
MQFNIKNIDIKKEKNIYIITGIFEKYKLSKFTKIIDVLTKNYISSLFKENIFQNCKIGQSLFLNYLPNLPFTKVLLVYCGKEKKYDEYIYKKIIKSIVNTLNYVSYKKIFFSISNINITNKDEYWKIRSGIEYFREYMYEFKKFKNNINSSLFSTSKEIIFPIKSNENKIICNNAIKDALIISNAVEYVKNLSNMPPNICNSNYLIKKTYNFANKHKNKIDIEILKKNEIKRLNMNAYLSVSNGSINEPMISIIKYNGNSNLKIKPIVIIGKGVTFDCGGISIKSSSKMDEMKYDMCGAASVYGIMHVISEMGIPLNVIGISAVCENMISERSYRPGDIIKTMSGKTVEILNTDAEGRLILCDILHYVKKFNPEIIIDIATLTGACVVALGHHMSGFMSNNKLLIKQIIKASIETGDLAWNLPISKIYHKNLKSNIADMTNTGIGGAGAINAACFLSKFISKKISWIHLDIAGTAWHYSKRNYATGRPVKLISQFLINYSSLYNRK